MKPFYYLKDKPSHLVVAETAFTFASWVCFVYLLFSLITFLVWGGASYLIYGNLEFETTTFFIELLLYALLAYVVLRFWAVYNFVRYGMNEKRTRIPELSDRQLAQSFGFFFPDYMELRGADFVIVRFDYPVYKFKVVR